MSKIHLISKIDHLTGEWWLLESERENQDGSITRKWWYSRPSLRALNPDDETAEEGRKP